MTAPLAARGSVASARASLLVAHIAAQEREALRSEPGDATMRQRVENSRDNGYVAHIDIDGDEPLVAASERDIRAWRVSAPVLDLFRGRRLKAVLSPAYGPLAAREDRYRRITKGAIDRSMFCEHPLGRIGRSAIERRRFALYIQHRTTPHCRWPGLLSKAGISPHPRRCQKHRQARVKASHRVVAPKRQRPLGQAPSLSLAPVNILRNAKGALSTIPWACSCLTLSRLVSVPTRARDA